MKTKTSIALTFLSTTLIITDLITQDKPALAQVPSGELSCVRTSAGISGTISLPIGRNSSVVVHNASEFKNALKNSTISTIFLAYNGNFSFSLDLPPTEPTRNNDQHRGAFIDRSVRIIGERGPLCERPIVRLNSDKEGGGMWTIRRGNVEIRGIHFIGAANTESNRSSGQAGYSAIHAIRSVEAKERLLIIDNEFNEWTRSGVYVVGKRGDLYWEQYSADWPRPTEADGDMVRIERNYFHHNAKDGTGYGVQVDGGIHPWILGNLFTLNRHAIASSGCAYAGYTAKFNYVMEGGYKERGDRIGYYNQHFDVHGCQDDKSNGKHDDDSGYGGKAGDRILIANNTFRGAQSYRVFSIRLAFLLRGTANSWARFNDNVVVHNRAGKAIEVKISPSNSEPFARYNLSQTGNQYGVDNVNQMLMGDFDGDGRNDLLLTNGTAWWVSRNTERPWEFLHASSKLSENLAVSDVDGDKIDDVLFIEGAAIKYLPRGSGYPKLLATLPADSIGLSIKSVAINGKRVYFVNKTGKVYELKDNQWFLLRENGKEIAVDSDGTRWLIDKSGRIYRYDGESWRKMPGSDGLRISAARGQVWLVNTEGEIYKWGGSRWNQMPGSDATDIAVNNNGSVLLTTNILVPDRSPSVPRPPVPNYKIEKGPNYKWNGSSWTQLYGDFVAPSAKVCLLGTLDGLNCYVGPKPKTGFIFQEKYFYMKYDQCSSGKNDGLNCLLNESPAGTKAFVYKDGFYTTPLNGNQCVLGTFDGLSCYLGLKPKTGFIFQEKYFYMKYDQCSSGQNDGLNCLLKEAPVGTKAFEFKDGFYTTPSKG
jgi:Tectonin domain